MHWVRIVISLSLWADVFTIHHLPFTRFLLFTRHSSSTSTTHSVPVDIGPTQSVR